ncbi:MAG: Phosphoadenosine phosphosulfate reductase [Cenarchaeum symbiont of Oopsacas minuta]|nr:Phosphoadenosine phosphosulfate reductase [Cenarchaeum symbiont of Oopsacas minuta]
MYASLYLPLIIYGQRNHDHYYKRFYPVYGMKQFTQTKVDELNAEISTAQEALIWASENMHPAIAKASSFGAEDSALIYMMTKVNPEFRFFTLDTGRLPKETHTVMDKLRKKYSMHLEVLCPDTLQVEEMVNTKGQNLFYESVEDRLLCCKVRKVNPTKRILGTLDGWITGMRKEHSKNRSSAQMFEIDEQNGGILKINPIIDWTWEQIMAYIKEHQIPYNALLDQNYPSIGCAPCTRAIKPGEDSRAGRWWWENSGHKECGLHMDYSKEGGN